MTAPSPKDADRVLVVSGEPGRTYGFPDGHPFGPDRREIFLAGLKAAHLEGSVRSAAPGRVGDEILALFHDADHVNFVREMSRRGHGYLDYGDTPAFPGVFEAASGVVGATLHAAEEVLSGRARRAFVPVAGMHHARRAGAAGFCVFNDIGVLIEWLKLQGVSRVAYVDIDAHHGDGVYYGFEADPDVFLADIHEDGRFLYPGTGGAEERGRDRAVGRKLNLPLPPVADDADFAKAWQRVSAHLETFTPELVILQAGADGLAGDPLTHLRYSAASHLLAASWLRQYADERCDGRLIALGGGGYAPANMAAAWATVVAVLAGRHGHP